MTIKNLLFLCLCMSNIHANILKQKPKLLSSSEITDFINKWETSFTWKFGWGCNFICIHEQNQSSFLVQALGVPIRSANFQYIDQIKKYLHSRQQSAGSYYFEKPLQCKSSHPKQITVEQLCEIISHKRCVFYTGAGISATEVAPMSGLEKSLALKHGLKHFLKTIYFNPDAITEAFTLFCKTAKDGQPTAAHHALHAITQHKNICLITENVDLLQQKTGSKPLFPHDDLNLLKAQDAREIDVFICICLSHDDRGLLGFFKKHNPGGFIIAINIATPDYLSDTDFILQADVQKILPDMALKLCDAQRITS